MSGADLMEKRIREYMEVKSGFGDPVVQERMLQREFRLFDEDGSGEIDMTEFIKVLETLNCRGSDDDVDELFDRYDADCGGTITYKEFTDGLFKRNATLPNDGDVNVTKSIVAKVKEEILRRGGGNGLRSAAVLLRRMDKDGSGNLDSDELKRGLEEMGIEILLDEDITRLMNAFDKDKSGKISVEEFFKGLQGDMKRKRKLLVRMAYDILDADGSGEVTIDDIRGAYDCSQHPKVMSGDMTEDEALEEILETYEQGEADGIVTFQEFLEYYRDVSAGIDDDQYFELMIRNAWHISGGEGAAANTSCRRVLVKHSDGSEEVCEVKNDLGIGPKDIDKM
eukprot:CAMPEP_0197563110 /NCGR_PEP_ID=MMETSP1320-20131121/28147_1 /TAXON_ID=91990 /ORGANISM="Bolidomonas sp., Strain RCC2347" /LENGTH=337 /DNA_ID=CAMNT_0043124891 /DNA_START=53 /DNA_END=1063 /DNA_ORIENTATION=+